MDVPVELCNKQNNPIQSKPTWTGVENKSNTMESHPICQECGSPYNTTSHRLVKECCGHEKCRQCLLAADNGCPQCELSTPTTADHVEEQENATDEICSRSMNQEITHQTDDMYWVERVSGQEHPETIEECPEEEDLGGTDDHPKLLPKINHQQVRIDNNNVIYEEVINIVEEEEDQEIFAATDPQAIYSDGSDMLLEGNINYENNYNENEKTYVEKQNPAASSASSTGTRKRGNYTEQNLPTHLTKLTGTPVDRYECSICDKILSKSNFVYHIYCDPTIPRPYPCTNCEKQFRTSDHLRYHMTTHETHNGIPCPDCNKLFRNKNTLASHVRQMHSGLAAPYSCEQCGKSFFSAAKFKLHMNTHGDAMDFACELCSKRFALKENLTKHLTVTHTEIKSFECPHCGQGFKRNGALKKHMDRLHPTGGEEVASLECKVCGKGFGHPTLLKRHERLHEDVVVEYRCKLCPINCARRDNLLRHLRVMHFDGDVGKMKEIQELVEVVERQRRPTEYEDEGGSVSEENVEVNMVEIEMIEEEDVAQEIIEEESDQGQGQEQQQQMDQQCRKSSVILYVGTQATTSGAYDQPPLVIPQRQSRPVPVKRNMRQGVDDFSNMSSDKMEIYRKILMPNRDRDVYTVEVEEEDN